MRRAIRDGAVNRDERNVRVGARRVPEGPRRTSRLKGVAGVAIAAAAALCGVAPASAADALEVRVARLAVDGAGALPLSLLDARVEDEGAAGAELGLEDNATTGRFLSHEYALEHVALEPLGGAGTGARGIGGTAPEADPARAAEAATALAGRGVRLLLADLGAEALLAVADAVPDSLVLNVRAPDDALRDADCRANVLHVAPSRAMLADALAQYLAYKRWDEAALVVGRHGEDAAYAAAIERAAGRFGIEIVERRAWTREPGARRTDSGHLTEQAEIPTFTRFDDHDVLLVADEGDEFGEYLPYRTERPRPLAGTQGLSPTMWSRTHEQWGATQLQRRFEALAGRAMTSRDQAAWLGVRAIGEAVTRADSAEPAALRTRMLGEDFALAGFKGVPLSFRGWNGQLRQPVLLSGERMLVSVSPQEGFLHPSSELDTLGLDRPESGCEAFDR